MGSILFLIVSPGAIPLRLDYGSYRGRFAVPCKRLVVLSSLNIPTVIVYD